MKFGKPKVEIVLRKDGEQDITVKCPEKIKLGVGQTILALRFGMPPMDVKPVDKKGLGVILGCFLSIFAVAGLMSVIGANPLFCALEAIGLVVMNLIVTKNYFFNFIKGKLADGYTVSSEHESLLQAAGMYPVPDKKAFSASRKKFFGIVIGILFVIFVIGVSSGSSL